MSECRCFDPGCCAASRRREVGLKSRHFRAEKGGGRGHWRHWGGTRLHRLLKNAESRSADLQIGCSGDVHIPAFRMMRNGSASCPSVDLEVHATAERELGATKFAREAIMGTVGQVLTGSESRSLVGLKPSS